MLKKIKHTLKILRCEQDFLTLLRSMNVMKLSPDKLLRIHLTFLITFIMDLFLFSKSLLVKVTLGHCPSSVLGWWISLVTQSTIFFYLFVFSFINHFRFLIVRYRKSGILTLGILKILITQNASSMCILLVLDKLCHAWTSYPPSPPCSLSVEGNRFSKKCCLKGMSNFSLPVRWWSEPREEFCLGDIKNYQIQFLTWKCIFQ